MVDVAVRLAENLKRLREERALTQAGAAELSGIPRPTWATLESGAGNPTLSVLVKAAAALQVTLEALIEAPQAAARYYPAGSLPARQRGDAELRELLPDPIPGMAIERLELRAASSWTSPARLPGTRAYLSCERGKLEVAVDDERYLLTPGDVLAVHADRRHAYRSTTREPTIAFSVVTLAPTGL